MPITGVTVYKEGWSNRAYARAGWSRGRCADSSGGRGAGSAGLADDIECRSIDDGPGRDADAPAGVKIGAKGFMLSWRVDDSGKSSMNETMFDLKIKSGKVTRRHWMGKKRRTTKGTPTIIYILAERVFGLAEGDVLASRPWDASATA